MIPKHRAWKRRHCVGGVLLILLHPIRYENEGSRNCQMCSPCSNHLLVRLDRIRDRCHSPKRVFQRTATPSGKVLYICFSIFVSIICVSLPVVYHFLAVHNHYALVVLVHALTNQVDAILEGRGSNDSCTLTDDNFLICRHL